jgi:hypothetical protein
MRLGAELGRHLEFHQHLGEHLDRVAQEVDVAVGRGVARCLSSAILSIAIT